MENQPKFKPGDKVIPTSKYHNYYNEIIILTEKADDESWYYENSKGLIVREDMMRLTTPLDELL